MITIDITKDDYDPNGKKWCFEISEKEHFNRMSGTGKLEDGVILRNPDTNKTQLFNFTKKDMDGTQEDTYGWRYLSECGGYVLLIIND